MRLTRRGRVVALAALLIVAFSIGFLSGPFSVDYSNGAPRVIDSRP